MCNSIRRAVPVPLLTLLSLLIAGSLNQSAIAETLTDSTPSKKSSKVAPKLAENYTVHASPLPHLEMNPIALLNSTTITQDEPQSQLASTPMDLLKQVPGVQINGSERSNGQTISLRGFGQGGVLVLIDGIRYNYTSGVFSQFYLDPSLIKRTTVIKGANSARYGNNALGGVVAFETVDATDLLRNNQKAGMRISSNYASIDNGAVVNLTGFAGDANLNGLVSAAYRTKGNFKTSTGERAPNKERLASLLAKAVSAFANGQKLALNMRLYNNEVHEPTLPNAVNANATTIKKRIHNYDTQLDYSIAPDALRWLNLKNTLYYSETEITSHPLKSDKITRKYNTLGLKMVNDSAFNLPLTHQNRVNYGAEVYRQKQKPKGDDGYFPNAENTFAGAWLSNVTTLDKIPLTLSAGVRFDHYEAKSQNSAYRKNRTNHWSPQVGIVLKPLSWFSIYGNYAEAFRAPSLAEMYSDVSHFSSAKMISSFVPNPTLKPEVARTTEVGINLDFNQLLAQDDNLNIKLSYFNSDTKDYMDFQILRSFDRQQQKTRMDIQQINLKKVSLWGIDGSINYSNRWVMLQGAINQTSGKNRSNNQWVSNLQPTTFSTSFGVNLTPEISATINSIYARPFTKVNRSTQRLSGYAVHNAYLGFNSKILEDEFQLTVGVENIFNKVYYSPSGTLQSARNVKIMLSYQW